MKYLIPVILLLSGCATCAPGIQDQYPKGEFFASILMTESAFAGPITKKEGFVFYIEQPKSEALRGPFLNGYRYKKGRLVEVFDHGSGAAEYIQRINELNFMPFDYEKELDKAIKGAEKDRPAASIIVSGARDGGIWELKIATRNGMFQLHKWNPGGEIQVLAPYSDNINKLYSIIKILAQYYGDYHVHM